VSLRRGLAVASLLAGTAWAGLVTGGVLLCLVFAVPAVVLAVVVVRESVRDRREGKQ
jgi:hypothetical protein